MYNKSFIFDDPYFGGTQHSFIDGISWERHIAHKAVFLLSIRVLKKGVMKVRVKLFI